MMNLPNTITVARMVIAPLIGILPFVESPGVRLTAFVLFIAAAVSDYYDGHIARKRNAITDLGRLLDPLADKLLLLATLIPMMTLMAPAESYFGSVINSDDISRFAFVTPLGKVPLPWWVVFLVLAREFIVTVMRKFAVRKGHVISAIGPAKWKTAFQSMWVGAAFFWFAALTYAQAHSWQNHGLWIAFEYINGVFGVVSMIGAVVLTMYSLWLYIRLYKNLNRVSEI